MSHVLHYIKLANSLAMLLLYVNIIININIVTFQYVTLRTGISESMSQFRLSNFLPSSPFSALLLGTLKQFLCILCTIYIGRVCLASCFNLKTAGPILLKFGTIIMPLELPQSLPFLISCVQ
jgi:hypothetical protein